VNLTDVVTFARPLSLLLDAFALASSAICGDHDHGNVESANHSSVGAFLLGA